MKNKIIVFLAVLAVASAANAATQEAIQQAIDDGLAYLAGTMTTSGTEGYWWYSNDGTLAPLLQRHWPSSKKDTFPVIQATETALLLRP
jgi:hypothetical protein